MEPEEPSSGAPTWPPPHPSPPLPPPREYGSPGTPLRREDWQGKAIALVVGLVLLIGFVWFAVGAGSGGADDAEADDPAAGISSSGSSSDPSSDPGSDSPTSEPPSPRPSPEATAAGTAKVRCWDGSGADQVSECSAPTGPEGLAWVFPLLPSQKCGAPTRPGDGVVLRILCSARAGAGQGDGGRILIGYYQWESVAAATAFYDGQGLERTEVDGVYQYVNRSADVAKVAGLYVDEPYSVTVTMPPGTALDDGVLSVRPTDQVRGEPVG